VALFAIAVGPDISSLTESARINNKIHMTVGGKNGWLWWALWRRSDFSVYVANFLLSSVFLNSHVVDYSLLWPKFTPLYCCQKPIV